MITPTLRTFTAKLSKNMPLNTANQSFFTKSLLTWYEPERRPLPWKHINDPYLIWLSEIILQQTRVEQGLAYYERFKIAFPRVETLAAATQDEVFKLWEGLGYYSRARNLHASAKMVTHEMNGQFPRTYKELLQLKGVGPYTAAAVASFSFGLPHAVVDGNVYRVLSRFTNDATPIDSTEGKKSYAALAQTLLDKKQAALYNQAIMDLGATICTPKKAQCDRCPLVQKCAAHAEHTIYERPIKVKKLVRRTRYFQFLLLKHSKGYIIHKRAEKDIWQGLYQFPLLETTSPITNEINLRKTTWPKWLKTASFQFLKHHGQYKQTLTHQQIIANFWEFELDENQLLSLPNDFLFVKPKKWRKFAFPKIISLYFDDNSLHLEQKKK